MLQHLNSRRRQILAYEPINNWKAWDKVTGYLPQSEMPNLIVELPSQTLGVGSFDWKYDYLSKSAQIPTGHMKRGCGSSQPLDFAIASLHFQAARNDK